MSSNFLAGQNGRRVRRDVATGHGAEEAVAGEIAPDRVARHAPRGAACGQQIGQSLAVLPEHAALGVDVQPTLMALPSLPVWPANSASRISGSSSRTMAGLPPKPLQARMIASQARCSSVPSGRS